MSIEDKLEYLEKYYRIHYYWNGRWIWWRNKEEKQADSLDNMLYRYDELRNKIIEEFYRLPDKR